MKTLFLLFCILSQTIIENPEKPLSKNAGRTVKLKKVMWISDVGEAFYFQKQVVDDDFNNK